VPVTLERRRSALLGFTDCPDCCSHVARRCYGADMTAAWKVLVFRRDGVCDFCGLILLAGIEGQWNSATKKVRCLEHGVVPQSQRSNNEMRTPELTRGTPGRSARKKYVELHVSEEEKIRQKFGRFRRLGVAAVFLHDDSQKTTNWRVGSSGEVVVGRKLDSLAEEYDFEVLHDRRRPPTKVNIDHLVITTAGVYVIDSKKYEGEIEVRSPGWFSSDPDQLFINRRNRTKIVEGAQKQVSQVEEALMNVEIDIPVFGVLTFVVNPLHIFIVPEKISGIFLSTQRGIDKVVCRSGPYSTEDIKATADVLAQIFPEA
jgi:hypothetical protein